MVFYFHRAGSAAYTTGVYKLPTDSIEKAAQYKEAPIKDTEEILQDDETKKLRENQATLIQIPVEVGTKYLDFLKNSSEVAIHPISIIYCQILPFNLSVFAEKFSCSQWNT